jgi:hypothetical protein
MPFKEGRKDCLFISQIKITATSKVAASNKE